MNISTKFLPAALAAFLVGSSVAAAQTPALAQPQARILAAIEESDSVKLTGNVHPVAATASVSRLVDQSIPMEHMILFLKGDATQEAQLAQFIAGQTNPSSPYYRHNLTPQDFGAQFGVATADLAKVKAWLQSHGFTVEATPTGNRAIVFSGTAGQVADAFQTEIHQYTVAGVNHYANVADPQIPAALAQIVGGVVKLHDFRHAAHISKTLALTPAQVANPQFTYGSSHYLSPADYGLIYDINPLYAAGIKGSGQTIAVLARSNIYLSDMQSFRSNFGLPANNPQIVITNSDPGVLQGDSEETTLDTEWSGAVAPAATVKVIVSASTNTADGIDLSALYAVNNNVAPIISLSYGSCEADMGTAELAFYNSLWQQAAAQGQTVLVSSGDSGAAGCYGGSSTSGSGAAVNGLCTSPYSTCVGGTEFVEGSNPGQYWLPGNSPVNGSAISYIPETVWNESGSNGGSGLWAGGGGVSSVYGKPSWQSGPGVPADGKRDVPDVSLTASGHDAYLVYLYGSLNAISGTSAAAPSFAGLMALVNQKANARQGLANSVLYPLAAKQAAGGAAVFHDITTGNNSVPGVTGFSATAGYDRATGLGSVDANLLVNHWADGSSAAPLSLAATSTTLSMKVSQTVQTTVTSSANAALKSAVVLTVTGVPAGLTATFASSTIASPGSGSVVLTVAAGASVTPGTYTLTVTATGGGQTAKLAISVAVLTPTFTLSTSVTSATAMAGGSAAVSVSSAPQNGFAATVALSVSGLPTGVTGVFSPASLTGAAATSSSLTLTVAKTVKAGTYSLVISAKSGAINQTMPLTLLVNAVPSCTLASDPGAATLVVGQTATLQLACGAVQGTFSAPLALLITGAPSGVTATASPVSLTAGASTAITLRSATNTAAGKYNLSVTASGSGFSQALSIPLTVTVLNTFTLTAAQTSLTAKTGTPGTITVSTLHQGIFNSAINLAITGLPAGVTAAFSKSVIPAPGDGTSTATFAIGSAAKAGAYSVSITATGAGISQTVQAALTIPPAMDFSFAVNVSALTIAQGGAGTIIVSTGNFTGGFSSTIVVTFSGITAGLNWRVLGATTGNNLVNVSDSLTSAANTPTGVYPVTVTATGAGITHSAVVQVTVTSATAQGHK